MSELSNTATISQNPTSLWDGHNFYGSLFNENKKEKVHVLIQAYFAEIKG